MEPGNLHFLLCGPGDHDAGIWWASRMRLLTSHHPSCTKTQVQGSAFCPQRHQLPPISGRFCLLCSLPRSLRAGSISTVRFGHWWSLPKFPLGKSSPSPSSLPVTLFLPTSGSTLCVLLTPPDYKLHDDTYLICLIHCAWHISGAWAGSDDGNMNQWNVI